MEAVLLTAAAWIDAAGIGPWVRGSANLYPWTNVVHVLGVAALAGSVGIMDLRLAGLWRAIAHEPLVRALTPVAIGGFIVMLASGAILFASDGPALARSSVFQVKLGLSCWPQPMPRRFAGGGGGLGSGARRRRLPWSRLAYGWRSSSQAE